MFWRNQLASLGSPVTSTRRRPIDLKKTQDKIDNKYYFTVRRPLDIFENCQILFGHSPIATGVLRQRARTGEGLWLHHWQRCEASRATRWGRMWEDLLAIEVRRFHGTVAESRQARAHHPVCGHHSRLHRAKPSPDFDLPPGGTSIEVWHKYISFLCRITEIINY